MLEENWQVESEKESVEEWPAAVMKNLKDIEAVDTMVRMKQGSPDPHVRVQTLVSEYDRIWHDL